MIAEILCTALVVAVPFLCGREKQAEQLPKTQLIEETIQESKPDFEVLEGKVDNLVQVKKQLESAEDGVNSVQQYDAEHQGEIQLKYTSAKTGKSTTYRFWLDGENQETDMLLRLMETERNRLRSVLLESIADLQE